jgi:hypothetical protein
MYGVGEVRRTLEELRFGLEARGIQLDTYDIVKYLYEELAYPLEQVEAYLQGKDSDKGDDVRAFWFFSKA